MSTPRTTKLSRTCPASASAQTTNPSILLALNYYTYLAKDAKE